MYLLVYAIKLYLRLWTWLGLLWRRRAQQKETLISYGGRVLGSTKDHTSERQPTRSTSTPETRPRDKHSRAKITATKKKEKEKLRLAAILHPHFVVPRTQRDAVLASSRRREQTRYANTMTASNRFKNEKMHEISDASKQRSRSKLRCAVPPTIARAAV